ncbi:MAG: NUDIX hydrolase [Candidatus Acidiferrales bacterium]
MEANQIAIKAMCLLVHDGKTLVAKRRDRVTLESFYRVLGGSLEFHESSEDAVRREIREELNSELENLILLEVIENRFVFEGNKGHEVVFLYAGTLCRKELYEQQTVRAVDGGAAIEAEWISTRDILHGPIPLYPTLDYKKYF